MEKYILYVIHVTSCNTGRRDLTSTKRGKPPPLNWHVTNI